MRNRTQGGQGKYVLASAIILAVCVAPLASAGNGDTMHVGARNAASKETGIISSATTYTTRQSNSLSGDGGAATYGCRSDPSHEPCVNVFNVRDGLAFLFQSKGLVGGQINITPPSGKTAVDVKPFTTNATGVATGLNADQVDGASADDLRAKFAAVDATDKLVGGRGATTVTPVSAGTVDVGFSSDVSACGYSATETTIADAGAAAVQLISPTVIRVRTRKGGGGDGTGPSDPAPRPFHLVVNC